MRCCELCFAIRELLEEKESDTIMFVSDGGYEYHVVDQSGSTQMPSEICALLPCEGDGFVRTIVNVYAHTVVLITSSDKRFENNVRKVARSVDGNRIVIRGDIV